MPSVNIYLSCCLPLLEYCHAFMEQCATTSADDNFRDAVVAQLIELERVAFALGGDAEKITQVKYALAAFIDEKVMYSSWPQRSVWMGRPLQLQLFGEHLAGEGFFNRLSLLRQAGQTHTDLLEVYYVCLYLGFRGMYRWRGDEQFLALQTGLRSQIETARGHAVTRLQAFGLAPDNNTRRANLPFPWWLIAAVTLTILISIYFFYTLAINAQAKSAAAQIQQDVARLSLTNGADVEEQKNA